MLVKPFFLKSGNGSDKIGYEYNVKVKSSPQTEKKLPIVNNQCVFFTNLNVICVTKIMLGTQPDIYTNASTNTNIQQSGGI